MSRLASLLLALAMCIALAVPALFYGEDAPSGEEVQFIPMSREAYIASKAAGENISYEAAEADVDSKIAAAIAAIPSTQARSPDTTVDNHDTTYTSYGRICKVYTHASGLGMRYSVEAVKFRSAQDANWIDLNASSACCQPDGNGNHNFIGIASANLLSNTQIRLAVTGYFEISKSIDTSSSINPELFAYSVTVGNTAYYRDNVNDVHIEHA